MRHERGAIERSVELVDAGCVRVFHVDGVQMPYPDAGEALLHLVEADALCLCFVIEFCTLATCEGCGGLDDDGFARFALEGDPGTDAVLSAVGGLVRIGEQKVSAEASALAPALIDAMDGVEAIDRLLLGLHLDVPFLLVAVRLHDNVDGAVLFGCDAEDDSVAASRHFRGQMLVWEPHGVVVGVRRLFGVAEASGAFLSRLAELAAQRGDGERAVVLRTAARSPMAASEALQHRVRIVVG